MKEIIQADIQSLLTKMENIEDLNKNQMETNISWTKVASLKHNKRKCKRQKSSDPLYLTSNFYNLLDDGVDSEDNTMTMKCSVNEEKLTVNSVRKNRTNKFKK